MIDCICLYAVKQFNFLSPARFAFDNGVLRTHSHLHIVVYKPATIYRCKWTYGTGNGIRTRTPRRATDFKSVVSTSFTIPANIKAAIYTCRAASPRSEAYIIEKPSA